MAPRKTKAAAAGNTSAGKKQASATKPAVANARVAKKSTPKKPARSTTATRAPSARVAAMLHNQLVAAKAEEERRAQIEAELCTQKLKRQAAASRSSARSTAKSTTTTTKTAAGKTKMNEPATKARNAKAKPATKATQSGRVTKNQSAATKKKTAPKSQSKTDAAKAKAAPKTATSTRLRTNRAIATRLMCDSTSTNMSTEEPAKKTATAAKKTTAATKKAEAKPAANMSRKRKAVDETEDDAPATKKTKTAATKNVAGPKKERKIATPRVKAAEKPKAAPKKLPVINEVPTQVIVPFVVGAGDSGELGLGTGKGAMNLPRAKPHPFFAAGKVEIVQLACGGMHGLALGKDGKVYSWGVNDDGALGRDTSGAPEKLRDMDAPEEEESEDDSDVEDNGLNPLEASPFPIDAKYFPEGVKISQIAAGDSISVFLLEDGRVFANGSFRVSSLSPLLVFFH